MGNSGGKGGKNGGNGQSGCCLGGQGGIGANQANASTADLTDTNKVDDNGDELDSTHPIGGIADGKGDGPSIDTTALHPLHEHDAKKVDVNVPEVEHERLFDDIRGDNEAGTNVESCGEKDSGQTGERKPLADGCLDHVNDSVEKEITPSGSDSQKDRLLADGTENRPKETITDERENEGLFKENTGQQSHKSGEEMPLPADCSENENKSVEKDI